jgi:hypothetical protein
VTYIWIKETDLDYLKDQAKFEWKKQINEKQKIADLKLRHELYDFKETAK